MPIHLAGILQQQSAAGGAAFFSDDFNRANEDLSASSDWEAALGDMDIVSNEVVSVGTAGNSYRCVGSTLANDQYAQATITYGSVLTSGPGVSCRYSASAETYYHFRWSQSGNQYQLFRVDAGSFTSIDTAAGATPTAAVFRIEANGSTIRGLVDGVEKCSATDTTITSGPYAGIRSFKEDNVFDDFSMGDL